MQKLTDVEGGGQPLQTPLLLAIWQQAKLNLLSYRSVSNLSFQDSRLKSLPLGSITQSSTSTTIDRISVGVEFYLFIYLFFLETQLSFMWYEKPLVIKILWMNDYMGSISLQVSWRYSNDEFILFYFIFWTPNIEKLYWSKLIYKYNAKTNVVGCRGGKNTHTSVPPATNSFSKVYTSKAERQGSCLHLTLG